MKIYISGKMSGMTESRIKRRFGEVAEFLRNEGFTPVNPAVMLDNPGLDYHEYMKIDYKMISVCDAIYMLEGWEESEGAKKELVHAISLDKKIILEGKL